jgi:microcin C transport system substrate-binding protein
MLLESRLDGIVENDSPVDVPFSSSEKLAMKMKLPVLIVALALTIAGCGKSSNPEPGSGSTMPAAPSGPVSMNKADYPVFPDADAGADPAVSAEQGGKGFTGKGWDTNTDFDFIGDPRALKGGQFRDYVIDFPGTLRQVGPESNTIFNGDIGSLAYESLLSIHPTTLEYVPALATHWQVSQDKMTYRFRINPNARFSDGTPVTSDDVVATYDLLIDKTLQDPMEQLTFAKFDRPVAESKYIVRVQAKELNWRNFLYFSGMPILPAHVLKSVNGEKYLKDYNFKLLPGSGPYTILDKDVSKGQSITVRRRKDYWAAKARVNVGMNNFDELRFVVVRDDNLAFEMFKKGELDDYVVPRPSSAGARQWVQELNFDNVQRGLIQKRKIFNANPQGIRGFALNSRRPPFDDIRVRKAMTLLLNRKQIIDKIMLGQYEPVTSYFAATPYENPADPKNEYDPQAAVKLLGEAGWNSRDSQGRLVKNGVPLQVELIYYDKNSEPELTVYQEDLRKVGVNLNLRLVTFETLFQIVSGRKFQMAHIGWTGLLFPNPETSFRSSLADSENNNNITGFKNARVDQLCEAYDKMFDVQSRIRAIREIDGILANDYQYVLTWDAPYVRIAYWNRFGTPPGYLSRTGDQYAVQQMWWIDPEKDGKLKEALRDSSMKFEVGATDNHYWNEFEKTHQPTQH